MSDGKYYWLKLKRDFFKRHDIRIVEEMPNGKEYILFYLKLLCESVDHEGKLRFSEEIPYSDEMLATITNTSAGLVRQAVDVFTKLGMMELLDDGTLFMRGVEKMIGSASDNDHAKRQARYRERQKQMSLECHYAVTKSDESKSKEIEIEKDTEIDSKPKRKRFVPPTVEEVRTYCAERKNNVDAERFVDFYESKGWMVGKDKMKDWKASVRTWEKREQPGRKQQVVIPLPSIFQEPQSDETDETDNNTIAQIREMQSKMKG